MENHFKTEDDLLQGIIDSDGECINASWCLMCPFSDICVSKAVKKGRLLSKSERVRKAYEKLFNKLMEKELSDSEG